MLINNQLKAKNNIIKIKKKTKQKMLETNQNYLK